MTLVLTRATKQAARYTDAGGRERCSGCRFFMPQGTCGRIVGPVSPRGWCKYFSQEAVQRWQPGVVPAQGGPSLALDFMNPGTFPTAVALTRASTATYFDSSGTMQTAAINAPRWDYNPSTLALQGLLIEEARTNQALQSANFSGGGWSLYQTTATGGIAGAPDGTATVSRIIEAAVTDLHFTSQNMTLTASTAYAASVYAKMAQVRYLQVSLDDGTANGGFATFDLQAGTISGALAARGTGVIGTATIQPVGNGFYRCAISTTIGAAVTGRMLLLTSNIAAPGFAPSYAGNTTNGILLWGAQLEAGAFPASYIPTTGGPVTRVMDVCYVPTAGWFTSTTYSLTLEFDLPAPAATYGGIGDNNFANAAYFNTGSWNYSTTVNGTSLIAGAVNKTCGTLVPAGQMKICNNGGAVFTGTPAGAAQATATRLALGNDPWSLSTAFNGHIRRVRYWPRVLSDTEMQAVTT